MSGHTRQASRRFVWTAGGGLSLYLILSLLSLGGVTGCDADADGKLPQEGCAPTAQATGSVQRVPHPTKPTKCTVVFLRCRYCQYTADGSFEKTDTKLCGICLIREF